MPYDLEPRYPVVGGRLEYGHAPLAAAAKAIRVIAIDGPAAAPGSDSSQSSPTRSARPELGSAP